MIGLWLIALHMLGDYVLQTNWMAARKFKSWGVRYLHVLLYTIPFVVFAYFVLPATMQYHHRVLSFGEIGWTATDHDAVWLFGFLIFVTHFITDSRRWASGEQWCAKPIMVDQTIHLMTLAILGTYFFGMR